MRGSSRFDRLLLRLARAGSVATRLTDGYARFFVPGSLLRDKLVLLLAILETSDAADRLRLAHGAGGPLRCVAGAAAAGLVSAVLLPLAVLCLAPLQFALKLTERRR
ncbi:MAG: hypothetical protein HKO62_06830 [Gammaproteobacteria bacterium]|nr:hypothetical protein [Gammaproteobacteria bacterium]